MWQDSNISLSITPSSVTKISNGTTTTVYDSITTYDRSQRVLVSSQFYPVKIKYGIYNSQTMQEDMSLSKDMRVPIVSDKSDITIICNNTIYQIHYDVQNTNVNKYEVNNNIQYATKTKNNILSPSKQYDYTVDDNKYVVTIQ